VNDEKDSIEQARKRVTALQSDIAQIALLAVQAEIDSTDMELLRMRIAKAENTRGALELHLPGMLVYLKTKEEGFHP